jgi:hypothetical protein
MLLSRSRTLLLLLFLASITSAAQNKSTATIKGKVRVEKGSPSGVAVILLDSEREVERTTTDRKGEFTLPRVPPGTYSVKFRKPGLSVGTISDIAVKAGQTRSLGDHLYLTIDEGSIAFVRGSVFNEGGRSVPGVRVELAKVLSEQSTQRIDARVTGETGEFVFRLPPDAAKYRLTIKADGFDLSPKEVEVDGAAVYRVALMYKRRS